MKNAKMLFSLVLIFCLYIMTFAACGESGTKENTSSAISCSSETTAEPSDTSAGTTAETTAVPAWTTEPLPEAPPMTTLENGQTRPYYGYDDYRLPASAEEYRDFTRFHSGEFRAEYFLNADIGWADYHSVAAAGASLNDLWKTTDGGHTWTLVTSPKFGLSAHVYNLCCQVSYLYFADEKHGLAVSNDKYYFAYGYLVLWTDDGGVTWSNAIMDTEITEIVFGDELNKLMAERPDNQEPPVRSLSLTDNKNGTATLKITYAVSGAEKVRTSHYSAVGFSK